MTLIEKLELIQRIDNLIRRKATGNPSQLATRVGLSKSGLFKVIQLMKQMDAPIYFCHRRNSYCYEYEVDFSIGFERSRKLVGGKGFNISLPDFDSDRYDITTVIDNRDILRTL